LSCRHGHMIGIDRALMLDGMTGDYEEVYQGTHRIYEVVRQAPRIEVSTRLGTELTAPFSRRHRWMPCDARYSQQGRWATLPDAEVFTAPLSGDGLLVGEELGDHFTRRYGLLEQPVRLQVRGGRVVAVEMDRHPEIKAEIEAYLTQSPHSNRAG